MTLEERLAKGLISQSEYDVLKAAEEQDAKAEAISETMDKQPTEFLAEFITRAEDLPKATMKREALKSSAMAGLYETQADLEGDRFARKAWGKLRINLRYVK
jgi:hypothetical protein